MIRPISVLLVDDDAMVSDSVTAWLEDDGFEVHVAATGSDAVQLLATTPVDVALIDLRLPDMHGEELLRQVLEAYPGSKFLIHTGTYYYRLSPELQRLGMEEDDIVYKPVRSLEQLSGMIRDKARRKPV